MGGLLTNRHNDFEGVIIDIGVGDNEVIDVLDIPDENREAGLAAIGEIGTGEVGEEGGDFVDIHDGAGTEFFIDD